MRLRRLDLTRYGRFTDYAIDFGAAPPGAPDLHIVYGLNEAGKSTSLSAYLDLLYGIEERSRYNFLHAYNAMQIGGCLEFNGGTHELKRVKQRTNALLDGRGEPVPEALLSTPLAGISREAYRTMFSLDDVTLEEGGNAILQSKGDLGELLFSASAGLAGVSTTLGAISDEADTLYKKRARSTRIAELKQKLAELKTRRDEIDTLASTHAGLVAALAQAQSAYEEAIHEQGTMKARREAITRMLRARPLVGEYRRLAADLSLCTDLPRAPADWARELPKLMEEETRLSTRIAGIEADVERVRAQIEAISVDSAILALSERVGQLDKGQARFASAEEDLPKRRIALAERQANIAAVLARLGQSDCKAPEALLLPAATVGTLRDLIEIRSGVEARLATATKEMTAARATNERLEAECKGLVEEKPPTEPMSISRLITALAVIRRSDHATRLRLAERGLPELNRRFQALAQSLAHLLDHDEADGEALRALSLPEPRQVEAWRTALTALERRIGDHTQRRRELVTQQGQMQARLDALRAGGGLIDDTEASRTRSTRDNAWREHLDRLDAASAEAFETAMREDDLTTTARLAAMRDLAELRALNQELAVTSAAIARQQELLEEAGGEHQALLGEIHATLPQALIRTAQSGHASLLGRIDTITRARADAIAAWERLEEARREIEEAKADAELDRQTLAAAMGSAGLDAGFASLAEMVEGAETTVAGHTARATAREAAEKALADHKRALAERAREFEQAKTAFAEWQAGFTSALSATWFAETTSAGAVREILETLSELGPALRERDDLLRRIDTMERDQQNFAADVQAILSELGENTDPDAIASAATALAARLETARRDRDARSGKTGELERLGDERRALQQALADHSARKAGFTGFFGVETLPEVAVALEAANERARRQARLGELANLILSELPSPSIETALEQIEASDFELIEQEAAELAVRLDDLDERTRQLFADRTRATDRLDAIGGDDQVARIEAERRTVFLEIEEHAATYLRLKSGALIAGEALRAYRDKHRSSMMKRASEAFRLITRGDYVGLATQPDKDRETLIGLSLRGGSKLANEMSKGTQFQLYLALRLAGYEEFAASRPSVPFIADDIMETFDEPRSEEVLRLFGAMAKIGQVIYLTHHRHLCDLARQIVPEVRIHEIAS
ncbi:MULTISPECIES: AAA family ATPase [Alphaproteobacteria]|uniref:Sugar translocase n=2 Tax=Alphaproteobacteria TaxID=28211 RepID=A0A512HL41_9HYPH|nr:MULTISPECIES: AAA family ATPase [Alphaproteobacteria]GEO86164.1 sugar translocase [Ciceribacter naphthalenivorans]GLR22731.1 sugar translocase [Ciceribacter naphthalenivorans]GLT05587.1 sugar translocase [Sphingomonas psychrolutea]